MSLALFHWRRRRHFPVAVGAPCCQHLPTPQGPGLGSRRGGVAPTATVPAPSAAASRVAAKRGRAPRPRSGRASVSGSVGPGSGHRASSREAAEPPCWLLTTQTAAPSPASRGPTWHSADVALPPATSICSAFSYSLLWIRFQQRPKVTFSP